MKSLAVLFTVILTFVAPSISRATTREEGQAIRNAFEDSILALRESGKLAQPPAGQVSFTMPADQERRMIALIEKGLSLGTKVTDHFLDWVHPKLKTEYRDHLIKGTQTYYDGLKASDPKKQAEGIALQLKWISFWNDNQQAIVDKLYGTQR